MEYKYNNVIIYFENSIVGGEAHIKLMQKYLF